MWRCSYRRRHMDSSRGVEHRYCTQIERRRGCCRFLLRRQSSSHKAAAPRISFSLLQYVCAAASLLLCSNQQFTAPTASPWFGSLLPRGQISYNSSACICMAPRNQGLRDMLPCLSTSHQGHACALEPWPPPDHHSSRASYLRRNNSHGRHSGGAARR